jgi:hypothetical protein
MARGHAIDSHPSIGPTTKRVIQESRIHPVVAQSRIVGREDS